MTYVEIKGLLRNKKNISKDPYYVDNIDNVEKNNGT